MNIFYDSWCKQLQIAFQESCSVYRTKKKKKRVIFHIDNANNMDIIINIFF